MAGKKYNKFLLENLSKISAALSFFSLILLASSVSAHPLGNFSVNRYSLLEPSPDKLKVYYVVDMAEIPALQERVLMDVDQDGTISRQERIDYLNKVTDALQGGLQLYIDGKERVFELLGKELIFPEGQGGLPTLRLTLHLSAKLPSFSRTKPLQIRYHDGNYAERLGWKEIIAHPAEGVILKESDVPDTDVSDALRTYPEKRPFSLLNVQTANIIVVPRAGFAPDIKHVKQEQITSRKDDEFTRLIKTERLTPGVVMIVLAMAFGLGAFHALSPGHGKSIVAAYLVGSRGTPKHALFLGVTVTLTHTFGVFLLGFITLFAFQYILSETLYPWLSIISGIIVFSIGAVMLARRGREIFSTDEYDQSDRPHPHNHCLPGHHHHLDRTAKPFSADGPPVTWKSLVALGISGGILPCPSALVVLLAAISMHRVGFGLILIVAFSIGLSSVLTVIGLVFVKARQFADRISSARSVIRILPAVSALVIMILGVGITANAWSQLF